jgi:hypothetical protein
MTNENDIVFKVRPFISSEQEPYLQSFAKAIASVLHHPEAIHQLAQTRETEIQFEKILLSLAGEQIKAHGNLISFGKENQLGNVQIENVAGGNITHITNLYFSLKEVSSEQEKARQLLETFLDPLDSIFAQTKKIHDELIGAYADLEYGPAPLKAYFESLPPTNHLKVSWYRKIQRLHRYNQQAINLIEKYRAHASETFRNATDEFRHHIEDWEDLWKAIEDITVSDTVSSVELGATPATPLSYETRIRGECRAAPFPSELDTVLANEIKVVRERAGQ